MEVNTDKNSSTVNNNLEPLSELTTTAYKQVILPEITQHTLPQDYDVNNFNHTWITIKDNNNHSENSFLNSNLIALSTREDVLKTSAQLLSTTDTYHTTVNESLNSGYFPIENVSSSASVDIPFTDGFTYTEKVVIGCFLTIIIVCAIAGNILVCVAIFTERNLGKASNYFYVSLALADLLVATVVMTFAVANDIMGHWVFGSTFCNIWLSSDVMCSTASILNICAISLDRFLHIKDPYHYENTMTHRKTLLFIAILWILSALISFLPIHLGWHKTEYSNQYRGDKFICLLDLNPTYAITSSFISFFIPCVIMIAIYAKLYMLARKHVKNIKRNSTWSAISTAMLDPRHPAAAQHHYRPSDQKAAITLGVIIGTFLFCWMPFFAINVITALCSTCVPPLLFNVFTWLGYINSMANPIIYPVFNKEFRTAFKRILSCPDYKDEDQDSHSRHTNSLVKTNKIEKKKRNQSSMCCHLCCMTLQYHNVQLNGNSANNLASPQHDLSTTDGEDKVRRCSESPLINTHVKLHAPESQQLNLDRVTVV